MSGPVRLVAAALGAALLSALAIACGGTSSSSATRAAPSVVEGSPDLGSGDGDRGDNGQMDWQATSEPDTYEPAAPEPEQPGPEPSSAPLPAQLTPAEIARIKALIVQASIDAYEGSCPCPDSEARDGSRCGGRSAYSRAGGEAPLCYPEDVSDEMVYEYWASQH